jgi:Ca2+/H+ antiporter
MYWLLLFIPITVALEHAHVSPPVLFFSAALSILPIARLIVLSTFLAILIATIVSGDGRSNWYKGAQLTLVYAMIATLFYFLPAHPANPH